MGGASYGKEEGGEGEAESTRGHEPQTRRDTVKVRARKEGEEAMTSRGDRG